MKAIFKYEKLVEMNYASKLIDLFEALNYLLTI